MPMPLTYPLSELDATSVAVAGGKASSLGELIRAGAPVPPGFVVTSAAFEAFMDRGGREPVDRTLEQLDAGRIEPAAAAQRIAAHLADVPVPDEVTTAVEQAVVALRVPRVSVRSSATCEDGAASAWAGQLETYLNVACEQVVDKVRDCWLSMFSLPALAYGAAHGYGGGRFAVAVVVQQMVDSEVSGVGFSVHPVTQEPDIQLIEACLGLGEAIVSGKIVPDQYVVDRAAHQIVERTVGQQSQGLFLDPTQPETIWRPLGDQGNIQKLSDKQVAAYADLLERIAEHYGYPVDTEWAWADGQFQVLQARPITTLADEYREAVIDQPDTWQDFIRRPMSLAEVSIWGHWMDSRHAIEGLGMRADRALAIQDSAGMSHLLLPAGAAEVGLQHISELWQRNRPQLLEVLHRGQAIYREAPPLIERGAAAFRDLDEATDFCADAAQHTTAFPAWVLMVCEREGFDDPEVRQLAEELRSRTLYPAIERQIIDPLVRDAARAVGFSTPEEAPAVITWSEVHRGTLDRETLEERLAAVRAGRRFVFQSFDGSDWVRFLSQTEFLLMRLAKQRQLVHGSAPDQLTGQVAWPGVYRGRARLVLAPDAVGQEFEEGEVLISIQSSPALMPLLQRAGAIVTDDGGIMCHAAIIARELRKPTLIGTANATSVIHTGDLIEVDTYAQVVRIVQHA